MNRCPITYESCEKKYSRRGLNRLSRRLIHLNDLPFTADELRLEAVNRASKMSVQGVQAKLSAVLNIKKSVFDIVETGGRYILKPQSNLYQQLPENEALTMGLASVVGIEVPVHGLVYAKDGSLTYFIKRFDRTDKGAKTHVEDFAQLAGESRDTKYNFSMERLIPIIDSYCSAPVVEKAELFKRTLFNFLIGNEDMHLKNFSLLIDRRRISLAPAYDFVNTTIALKKAQEEIALPLHGKKRGITAAMLFEYFGQERLNLSDRVLKTIETTFTSKLQDWRNIIGCSFLSETMKKSYLNLLEARASRLGLPNP